MNETTTRFVGLDIGDRYTHFVVLDGDGAVVSRDRFRTRLGEVDEWLEEMGSAPSVVALETGVHSRWIGQMVRDAGHDVVVANTRELALISKNVRKSDEADAELLARLVRADRSLLHPVEGFLDRDDVTLTVIRGRDALVRARSSLVIQVRGLAKAHGVVLPGSDAGTFHKNPVSSLPQHLRDALAPTLRAIEELTAQIESYDRDIEQISENAYPETKTLRTIPGVGPVTALAFVAVIGNPERFENSRSVGAYLGLTPRRDQSGDSDPELRITKHGDRYVRRLLVSCAQRMLSNNGTDCALRDWGLRRAGTTSRREKKRAVVGVARRLAVVMHAMLRTGEEFRPWPNGRPELVMKRTPVAA